jgi:hypothetical protein
MKNRFSLENNEAASNSEAAFILDSKTQFRARIIRFRSLTELDQYQPTGLTAQVRLLPILVESVSDIIPDDKKPYWLKRMADWYYFTHIKPGQVRPESTGTEPPDSSAD